MVLKKYFSAGFLLVFLYIFAQENEQKIDTVVVFDQQLKRLKNLQKVITLSPEDIIQNADNLSDLLRFQSPLYIKENGRGASASPSFRGTTAQQTAFVWNGININSQFLGQGDVNNISFLTADALEVKSGGGSVIYGSGAIGGSIHLNNNLQFSKGFNSHLYSEIGSFGTFINLFKTSYSNGKWSVKFAGNYTISQNDFEVEERQFLNRNGKYDQTNLNIAAAYKLNDNHQVSWISEYFNGTQYFPNFSELQIKTKYETANIRNLISWDWTTHNVENRLIAAYTEENFDYFNNIQKPKLSGATGKNYIVKNDFNYLFSSKFKADVIAEFQENKGEGYGEGIGKHRRNIFSASALLSYFPIKKMQLQAGIKKDFVENLQSPLLFSVSGKWQVTPMYNLGFDFSHNFRFPTFNDLYWQQGGNPNLKSETAYQVELRNTVKSGSFSFSVTPYFMDIKDMIVWTPTSLGFWSPININKVQSLGVEARLDVAKKWDKLMFKANLGYSYTQSKNKETGKQLMYVPLHKIYGNLNLNYDFVEFLVQGFFNGLTYTDTNEKRSEALTPYFVINSGIDFTMFKNYKIGLKVNNVFDEIYATSNFYFMPKRNYNIHLNINF